MVWASPDDFKTWRANVLQRDGNQITFAGEFSTDSVPGALALIHQTSKAGFEEVVLDFGSCVAAFPVPILAICSQVMKLRANGQDFELILPQKAELAKLFRNANWAFYLDPARQPQSTFRGFTQLATTQFTDAIGQTNAVNQILGAVMGAIAQLDRRSLSALEWSVNEITDNVLNHSQSPVGGLVQMTTFERTNRRIEYVVVDAGIGIPKSLRQSHHGFKSDTEALERAIREGVTRDPNFGQGNGLYGSYQIASHSMGSFLLQSGNAKLIFNAKHGLRVSEEKVPFPGTLVAAQVNISDPSLLAEAMKFGGRVHVPVDFIETHYEHQDRPELLFTLKNETSSFGSRVAGMPIRTRLANLVRMCPGQRIVVDFADVPLVSSSFADEVFGKLFMELGPMSFAQRFEFRNVCTTVQQLTDRAISQRLARNSGTTSNR